MEAALQGDNSNQVEKSRKYLGLSFNTFDASVRCITWRGFDDPDKLFVGGYDGKLALMDTKDPFMPLTVQRARGRVATHVLLAYLLIYSKFKASCMRVPGQDTLSWGCFPMVKVCFEAFPLM